jgi:hypothetical protein
LKEKVNIEKDSKTVGYKWRDKDREREREDMFTHMDSGEKEKRM